MPKKRLFELDSISKMQSSKQLLIRYKPGLKGLIAASIDNAIGVIGPKQYAIYSNMNRGKLITSGITKKEAKKL